jgi:predicted Zn-dependent protease
VPRAEALAADLERRFPEDTCVRFSYLPSLRGQIALRARDPARALGHLQAAARLDLAVPALAFNGFLGVLYPTYVRGTAHLAAERPLDAIREFQRILDHRGIVLGDPMDALARLQLARAFASSGDDVKAKAAYQDLLRLWSAADPDITLLRQARTEYSTRGIGLRSSLGPPGDTWWASALPIAHVTGEILSATSPSAWRTLCPVAPQPAGR